MSLWISVVGYLLKFVAFLPGLAVGAGMARSKAQRSVIRWGFVAVAAGAITDVLALQLFVRLVQTAPDNSSNPPVVLALVYLCYSLFVMLLASPLTVPLSILGFLAGRSLARHYCPQPDVLAVSPQR